jgi:MtN3 and saliva related transmembrane protein
VVERDTITQGGSMVSTALGITAASWAVLMALSPILQIREIRRRRTSEGISIGFFAVLLIGFVLWISYGIATHNLPLVIPNCVAFLVMGCTIIVVVQNR